MIHGKVWGMKIIRTMAKTWGKDEVLGEGRDGDQRSAHHGHWGMDIPAWLSSPTLHLCTWPVKQLTA